MNQYLRWFKAIRAKCQALISEADVIKIAIAGIQNFEMRKRLAGKNIKDFNVLYSKVVDFEKVQKEETEEVYVFSQGQSVNMVDVRPMVKHSGGSKQCSYGY